MSGGILAGALARDYVTRFDTCRICVVGDVMLDRYFWGEVDRISPEAPVPIVRVGRRSSRPGGAANVAANLQAIGVRVTLVGATGDDRAGEELRKLLGERGIDTGHLVVEPQLETTEKVRIIARNQQVVRADFESDLNGGEETLRVLSNVTSQCAEYDALVVSDYGKGLVNGSVLHDVIVAWREGNKPVLVDPFIGHFQWYRGASIVTPNTKEAASYFGGSPRREDLFDRLGFQMVRELEIEALLVTRGEEGMTLLRRSGERIDVPTVAKEVFDVTGAGDTVISVLSAAVACRVPLEDAVALANQAAGEVVKEVGTSAITSERLAASFS